MSSIDNDTGPHFVGIGTKGRHLVAVFRRHAPPGGTSLLLMDAKQLERKITTLESKGIEASYARKALEEINAFRLQNT